MADRMKILIVEDDPIIAEDLEAYMMEFGYTALKPVDNAADALKSIRINEPDLCLLDVHLSSEIDGIQLAKMIKEKTKIPLIFLTAFNDRDTVDRIKETGPSAYLVKPVDERNLRTSIELAFSNFYSNSPSEELAREDSPKSIFIKIKDRLTRFRLEDILYFEAYDNYAFLHTSKEKHILSASLKQVEEKLPGNDFIRTHRSFIVNLRKVEGIGGNHILIERKEIPIGKTFREQLMRSIDQL